MPHCFAIWALTLKTQHVLYIYMVWCCDAEGEVGVARLGC